MRSPSFDAGAIRRFLWRNEIATLSELKKALGTTVGVTCFRKLKELDYLSSYSHRGGYYTLREIARFGADGLWSTKAVWFSRYGTLMNTVEAFVSNSARGCFAAELAQALHVEVQDALLQLVGQHRVSRQRVGGLYLYMSNDGGTRRGQLLARQTQLAAPMVADPAVLEVPPDDLKAAVVLFYSLLDEKQRRLYAGLESLKLGRGGDRQLAEFLRMDAHTVARGRQELLQHNVDLGRVRRAGAGRKRVEKKRRES